MSSHINRLMRIRDLRRALTHLWRRRLPDNDRGRRLLVAVIDHARLIQGDLAEKMAAQLAPPAMTDAEVAYLIDRAGAGRMWSARELAEVIGLTEADRVKLQITTIGAIDCSPGQRKRRRRLERLKAAASEPQSPGGGQPRLVVR